MVNPTNSGSKCTFLFSGENLRDLLSSFFGVGAENDYGSCCESTKERHHTVPLLLTAGPGSHDLMLMLGWRRRRYKTLSKTYGQSCGAIGRLCLDTCVHTVRGKKTPFDSEYLVFSIYRR